MWSFFVFFKVIFSILNQPLFGFCILHSSKTLADNWFYLFLEHSQSILINKCDRNLLLVFYHYEKMYLFYLYKILFSSQIFFNVYRITIKFLINAIILDFMIFFQQFIIIYQKRYCIDFVKTMNLYLLEAKYMEIFVILFKAADNWKSCSSLCFLIFDFVIFVFNEFYINYYNTKSLIILKDIC